MLASSGLSSAATASLGWAPAARTAARRSAPLVVRKSAAQRGGPSTRPRRSSSASRPIRTPIGVAAAREQRLQHGKIAARDEGLVTREHQVAQRGAGELGVLRGEQLDRDAPERVGTRVRGEPLESGVAAQRGRERVAGRGVEREALAGLLDRDEADARGEAARRELATALDALEEDDDLVALAVERNAMPVLHEPHAFLVRSLEHLQHFRHDHGLALARILEHDLGRRVEDADSRDQVRREREQAQRRRAVDDVRARRRRRGERGRDDQRSRAEPQPGNPDHALATRSARSQPVDRLEHRFRHRRVDVLPDVVLEHRIAVDVREQRTQLRLRR